jgi:putative acetyltransferase
MRIAIESPSQPDVLQLIDDLDAYQKPLYPPESHHGIDLAALSRPDVVFAVARDSGGRAMACGAVVVSPRYGELKRMYTRPECRGQGIAKALLGFLEAQAIARGVTAFKLETGFRQPEAIGLYGRCGYAVGGPFGDYAEDPNSVFMHKSVA